MYMASLFDKVIKCSISCYMIFVKNSKDDLSVLHVYKDENKKELEFLRFIIKFNDIFLVDILLELPLKRGIDDHFIDLVQHSSPPNKPPYRVSQDQKVDIMRQMNDLVDKRMVQSS